MAEYNIFKRCNRCEGDGIHPDLVDGVPGGESCVRCAGTGKYFFGIVDLTDFEDKINDILNKVEDIKEVVDNL